MVWIRRMGNDWWIPWKSILLDDLQHKGQHLHLAKVIIISTVMTFTTFGHVFQHNGYNIGLPIFNSLCKFWSIMNLHTFYSIRKPWLYIYRLMAQDRCWRCVISHIICYIYFRHDCQMFCCVLYVNHFWCVLCISHI